VAGVQGSPGLGPGPLVAQREHVGQGPLVGDPQCLAGGHLHVGQDAGAFPVPPETGL
jgi:hypothetical protein